MRYFCFDIDGVISDQLWRERIANNKNWDLYHSLSIYDMPIFSTVNEMRLINKNSENKIWLITGRTEKFREITTDWLNKFDVPWHALYMRGNNDFTKASEMKLRYVKSVMVPIELFVDDNKYVVEAMKNNGIKNPFHFLYEKKSMKKLSKLVDKIL